jgi:hypothetical protein
LLCLAAVWLATGPVAATTTPSPPPTQPLIITSGEPADELRLGDVITVAASGLFHGRQPLPCLLMWDDTPIGSCTDDGAGSLTGALTVPTDGTTGLHLIRGCLVTCLLQPTQPTRTTFAAGPYPLHVATVQVTVLPRPVVVPHLQGLIAKQAVQVAKRHGLSVDPHAPGTYVVASQRPHAGTLVAPGTIVHLVLVRPGTGTPVVSTSATTSSAGATAAVRPGAGVRLRLNGGTALLVGGFALAGLSGARLRAHRQEQARRQSRRWVRDHLGGRGSEDPRVDAQLADPGNGSAPRLSLRGIPDPTDDDEQ